MHCVNNIAITIMPIPMHVDKVERKHCKQRVSEWIPITEFPSKEIPFVGDGTFISVLSSQAAGVARTSTHCVQPVRTPHNSRRRQREDLVVSEQQCDCNHGYAGPQPVYTNTAIMSKNLKELETTSFQHLPTQSSRCCGSSPRTPSPEITTTTKTKTDRLGFHPWRTKFRLHHKEETNRAWMKFTKSSTILMHENPGL